MERGVERGLDEMVLAGVMLELIFCWSGVVLSAQRDLA